MSHQKRRRSMRSAETETEARVGLSVVNPETGEITEGECSLEDFQRLPDIMAERAAREQQLALFDGEEVKLLTFNCKSFKGVSFKTPKPLKIGDEIEITCRAKVVEVKAHRNNELGWLVREHTLMVHDPRGV